MPSRRPDLRGINSRLRGRSSINVILILRSLPLLGPYVEFIGHIDHEEMSEVIGRAAVGLFTSVWEEPFGLVLIEMLACGTPVVAFDGGAVPEILTDVCGVVVPNKDWRALARAMPVAAGLNRADCREYVLEAFPIGKMVDLYEGLYFSWRENYLDCVVADVG